MRTQTPSSERKVSGPDPDEVFSLDPAVRDPCCFGRGESCDSKRARCDSRSEDSSCASCSKSKRWQTRLKSNPWLLEKAPARKLSQSEWDEG